MVQPDWSSPRLKGSWFTGTWVLRDAGSRLARFKVRYLYGRSTNVPRRAGDRLEVGSIEIYEGLGRYPQLPLVILLALETIKAERAMVVPMWK